MIATALVIATSVTGAIGVAKPAKTVLGNVEVEFGGRLSPSAIPTDKSAPIVSVLWGKVRTLDIANPPAPGKLRVVGDKGVALHLEGLPRCRLPRSNRLNTSEIRKLCGPSIVGTGRIEGIVVFPGDQPIDFASELIAVKGGPSTLYAYAFFTAPVTAAIAIPIEVKKVRRGKFGTESIASLPKIAGGSGSVTYFKLSLEKGVLRATCAEGQLRGRVTAAFAGGTRASVELSRRCARKITPATAKPAPRPRRGSPSGA